MKRFLRAFIFLFLLVISRNLKCYSEESLSPYQKSVYAEEYLAKKELDPQQYLIAPEYSGKFPYNIAVEIPASSEKLNTGAASIDQVIFSFTQDFFIKSPEFIVSFIERTKSNNLPYICTILLTADEEKNVLKTDRAKVSAGEYYAERLYETDGTCALVITDEDYFPSQIRNADAGKKAPMWLVRAVLKSFNAQQKNVSIQQNILYQSKSGIFKTEERLAAFNKNDIMSAGFSLGHNEVDLKILNAIENEIAVSGRQGGNTLYNVIPFRAFSVWINESLLTFIYLVSAAIALFTVCFSSFAYNAKNEAVFKDFSRTWFLTPAYLILGILFLSLFQWLFSATVNKPVLFFSLKTVFTICVLFIVSAIQNFYKLRISLASISYQILILCALNIFIFAFIDLSLMFVFIIEYLIILLEGKSGRRITSFLVLILMIAVYVQPAASLYQNVNPDKLSDLFITDISKNILFSFILVPVTFQWIRCIMIFNLKDNPLFIKLKSTFILEIILSAICSTIVFLLFISGISIVTRLWTKESHQNLISVTSGNGNEINIGYSTSDNFDLITHRLNISASENHKILRCFITLKGTSNPLYECNFNYTIKSATEAEIEIPDGAENEITLMFSSDYGIPVTATMEFYILKDELNAVYETKEVELTGKITDGKAI